MAYCLGFHFLKDLFKKPPLFNLGWKIQFNQRTRTRAQGIPRRGVPHAVLGPHTKTVALREQISFGGSAWGCGPRSPQGTRGT